MADMERVLQKAFQSFYRYNMLHKVVKELLVFWSE